jgi:hypothetical protein
MPFDPDAYLAATAPGRAKTGGGFDPDAYLAATAPPTSTSSKVESVGAGALEGASKALAGLPDKVGAALFAGSQMLPAALGGTKGPTTFGKEYDSGLALLDESRANARKANPDLYSGGNTVGGFAPLLIPGLGPAQGATRALRLAHAGVVGMGMGGASAIGHDEDPLTGAGLGLLAGVGGEGVLQGIGAVGRALSPRLQAWQDRVASLLGDKAAKSAEATAKSAAGASGAARANASRTVERLGMPEGLSAAEQAQNAAALGTPEAQQLAAELAAKARGELPGKLMHMQNAEALAAQTAADVAPARAFGQTTDYAAQMLAQRAKAQLNRYAIPAAGGVAGYLMGDDGHKGSSALAGLGIGAAAGRGISPAIRAVVGNLALSPEAQRLAAAKSLGVAQRLAGVGAPGSGAALGKFAPVLQGALQRGGPDGFAAAHFALQTDPEYQKAVRAAEGAQP